MSHHDHRHPSTHGEHPIDAEASELELIQHLARHLRRGSAVETAPWGLSPHQARALGVIARSEARHHRRPGGDSDEVGGLRLGALAGWLQIAPRSATEVVDALEELGLVTRTPDPADRRAVLVTLTDRGREASHEIRAARRAQSETLLDELSAQDRAQLRASLLTLLEAATR
ncbi:MarR family winged helix-turn-helix transcriptional regulator [Ornithinimicrobium cavernae]|uniref:MarR family winged helix-turn-helix transcriptional regulator n=1 Tax=Ornithinimicrobium cavernae TaxID=2666047 RepID=UPI001F024797|nr:MarR family transcriptional regulator [Ornithinimicrobium cavernae]